MRILIASALILCSSTTYGQTKLELIDRIISDINALKQLLLETLPSPIVLPVSGAQATLDAVAPGSIVELQVEGIYPALTIRVNGITLRSLGYNAHNSLPSRTGLAKIPTLIIESDNVTILGIEIGGVNSNDLVQCKETAEHIIFKNNYIHGHPTTGSKRGIALNCTDGTIVYNIIEDIFRVGQDSTGIGGWNGPGPYSIENNYIKAASEAILFGGVDPSIVNLIPSDIVIKNNLLTKDVLWKNKGYSIKNALELKNARRVTIENNTIENVWIDGQTGYGVLFSVKNQEGSCTWCTIEDVMFTKNTIRNVGAGFSILGTDYVFPSGRAARIQIVDNDIELCGPVFNGTGVYFFINNGPDNLSIINNRTAVCLGGNRPNSFMSFDNENHKLTEMIVTGNLFHEGSYGILGANGPGLGVLAWDFYNISPVWNTNTVLKYPNGRTIKYPTGTTIIPLP